MSASERLDRVRQHLLSMPETGDAIEREAIVIWEEHYVGRRFEMAEHRAIWFAEADELKVYVRGEGHLVTLDSAALDVEPATELPSTLPMFAKETSEASDADAGIAIEMPIRKAA